MMFFVECDISSRSQPPLPPHPHPTPAPSLRNRNHLYYKGPNHNPKKHDIKTNCYDALQIIILSLGVFVLLRISLLHLCTHVSYVTFSIDLSLHLCTHVIYVTFSTDLSLYSKKNSLSVSTQCFSTFFFTPCVCLALNK